MDAIGKAGFDHPCKDTCSGWTQGYSRGQEDFHERVEIAIDFIKRCEAWFIRYNDAGHAGRAREVIDILKATFGKDEPGRDGGE